MRLDVLVAALDGVELHGDGSIEVDTIAPISRAGHGQLSFAVSNRYIAKVRASQASALVLPPSLAGCSGAAEIISSNPYLIYAKISQILYPGKAMPAGVADSACVEPSADIGAGCSIGQRTSIGANTRIGAGTVVETGCHIGDNVSIGKRCHIRPNVTILDHCLLGDDCRVQSGAVIGSDGFGYAPSPPGWEPIRQVGRVVIGNHVEIGANTTIDRGALDDTVIEDHVILDNLIQIAHNVRIGTGTAIAACVGIAGSTRIGSGCRIGGKSAIVGHVEIADNVELHATSFVTQSITEPGSYGSGTPLLRTPLWRRTYVRLSRLDDLARQVARLMSD